MTQKLHFFAISVLVLIAGNASQLRASPAKCARDIGTLSRELSEHQDETRGALDLSPVFNRLIQIPATEGHVGRLIALGNGMRFYALFGNDPAQLRAMREEALREEDRLLKASRTWEREDQASFVETLGEFNQSFYKIFSLEEAEAFYADLNSSEFELSLHGGKKKFFAYLIEQYEKVFAPAFPLPVAETLTPLQTKKRMDLLQYELESMDLDISTRARWFLTLAYGHLSYRARWREHINRDPAINFLTDQMSRERGTQASAEAKSGDPLRNTNPIGKAADYTSAHEQELEQVRLFAETIEQLQLKPSERAQVETWIEEVMGLLTPSQYYLILPESVTAQGLTIYQVAQMGPYKKLKDLVNRAIARYSLGARPAPVR